MSGASTRSWRRFAPLSLTVLATALCLGFVPEPPAVHAGVAAALGEARARNALVLVHVASPDRALDAEAAAVFAEVRDQAPHSWAFARVAATDVEGVEALCGERVAVALVVVHAGLGPLAAWSGRSAPVLRLLVARAASLQGRAADLEARAHDAGARALGLAQVRLELASPVLALAALARAVEPGNPAPVRAAAFAAIARCEAEAGASDRADAALSACRALAPELLAAPATRLTQALAANHALAPAEALESLAALDRKALPPDDRALAQLVRADALHQLGRSGESLAVLHEILADRAAELFFDTALARVAHLLAPNHGHSH